MGGAHRVRCAPTSPPYVSPAHTAVAEAGGQLVAATTPSLADPATVPHYQATAPTLGGLLN